MILPRFTMADMERANESWGANCGPGSVAAICGMTLDEVKLRFVAEGFIDKRYTNPTMMFDVLESVAREGHIAWRKTPPLWPVWGLVRIQWEGPWTAPGVPMRARYRHTHWVGAMHRGDEIGIFDVNALSNGTGWVVLEDWSAHVVPWILQECVPRSNGQWSITHAIEVERRAP
jgi:hypothetical protein